MPIDDRLFDILLCPLTGKSVRPLAAERLVQVNQRIQAGELRHEDGTTVEQPLDEGLISADDETVYRIDEGIPVMLPEKAIRLA